MRPLARDGQTLGARRRRDYGYRRSHSRFFWGFRLHAIFAPDGNPRALELVSPKIDERDIGLVLLDRVRRHGGEILLGDKDYAGRQFAHAVSKRNATIVRPRRKTNPDTAPTSRQSANASRAFSGPAKAS